jgi:hypothetical protein
MFSFIKFSLLISQIRNHIVGVHMKKREHEMKKPFTLKNINEFRFEALSFMIFNVVCVKIIFKT